MTNIKRRETDRQANEGSGATGEAQAGKPVCVCVCVWDSQTRNKARRHEGKRETRFFLSFSLTRRLTLDARRETWCRPRCLSLSSSCACLRARLAYSGLAFRTRLSLFFPQSACVRSLHLSLSFPLSSRESLSLPLLPCSLYHQEQQRHEQTVTGSS